MHKKLLSVLLALVMILSVLPMAAFAEETEHTHDENCGCVTTLAVCTHLSYKMLRAYTEQEFLNYYQHVYYVRERRICNLCNTEFIYNLQSWYEDHNNDYGMVFEGEVMNEEEVQYIYRFYCSCGFDYLFTSSTRLW